MKYARLAMLLLGIYLLVLNLYGVVMPYPRHSEASIGGGVRLHDVTITHEDAIHRIGKALNEKEFAKKITIVNEAVAKSVVHVGDAEVQIPASENWVLHVLGRVAPTIRIWNRELRLFPYNIHTPAVALQRGTGKCGQVSVIVATLLHDMGIQSGVIAIGAPRIRHLVAYAVNEQGQMYVLDPDYDVVVPFSPNEFLQRGEEVLRLYDKVKDQINSRHFALVGEILLSGKYKRIPYDSHELRSRRLFEQALYVAKWVIPLSLVGFAVLPVYRQRKRSKSR